MRSTRAARAGSSSGWMAADRWSGAFARRTRTRGGAELTTILAGTPPEVLSMAGGFPNPETFATDVIDELAARLVREDAAVALQYTPVRGRAQRAQLPDRPAGAAAGPAAGARRADGDQRRDGVHRADVPGAARSRRHGRRRGADLSRRADGLRRGRGRRAAGRDGRARPARRRAGRAAGGGRGAEVRLRDPRVPEPDRPDDVAVAPARARRPVPAPRRAGARGRGLPRALLRRRPASVAVVARPRRRAPGRHVLEDLLPGRPARLGGRAAQRRRGARGGQAEHGPVRERARPAAGRGVRPRGPLRAPAARRSARCTRRARRRSAARWSAPCRRDARGRAPRAAS